LKGCITLLKRNNEQSLPKIYLKAIQHYDSSFVFNWNESKPYEEQTKICTDYGKFVGLLSLERSLAAKKRKEKRQAKLLNLKK
jgi:hypothetical protein